MRSISLIHTVLAALLWCAVVFVFVGMSFMKYETIAQSLRKSRMETALEEVHKVILLQMDKGSSLPEAKKVQEILSRYANSETNLVSVSVFDTKTDRVLFGSPLSQTGRKVPDSWRKKCVSSNSFFSISENDKEIIGRSVSNAFLEKVGCLIGEYTTENNDHVRKKMVSSGFRLAAIGVSVCFVLFFFKFLASTVFAHKKFQTVSLLFLFLITMLFAFYFNIKAVSKAFDAELRQEIGAKSQLIAGQISSQLEQMVQNGVPFESITSLEMYMDQIRQKNKEILFILVTDKTGRVLYESGSAAEAFEADPHTGKISLRDGYYNAAEAVNGAEGVIGWVQIGVNERGAREKII